MKRLRQCLCILMLTGYLWAYSVGGVAGALYSATAAVTEWPLVVLFYPSKEELGFSIDTK